MTLLKKKILGTSVKSQAWQKAPIVRELRTMGQDCPWVCYPGTLAELVSSKLNERLFLQRGGVQVKTLTPGRHTYSTQHVLLYTHKSTPRVCFHDFPFAV